MLVAEQAGLIDLAAQLADLAANRRRTPARSPAFPCRGCARRRVHGRSGAGLRARPHRIQFRPRRVSPAGARGLMQIMPVTAGYIAGDHPLRAPRLHDPALNLDLGQRYVAYLADQTRSTAT